MKSSLQGSKVRAKQIDRSAVPLEQKIRDRAYELYERRGRVDGQDVQDWLQAETEVTTTVTAA